MSAADARRYAEIIDGFPGCPIVVYGDLVADEFVFGEFSRISREAPVLILKHRESRILPGGAANAINNLIALEAHPVPVGILGRDDAGEELHRQLRDSELSIPTIERDRDYTTPVKTRFVAGSAHSTRHQVLRLDREGRFRHTRKTEQAVWRRLAPLLGFCKGLIISDYGMGYVSPELVARLAGMREEFPITVDSRYQLLQFPGLTASTPNEPEVEALLGYEIGNDRDRLEKAGRRLLRRLKSEAVLITRGRDGMVLFTPRKPSLSIPIFGSDQVADVTGAGDTVIAVFTLALAAGASFEEASRLSNYAGGLVVMKHGTATVSRQELKEAVARDRACSSHG
ncbi:MAG: bifunctional ADP-heptose synthase [Acidobacteriota bacterium]|nr:bifunctional ADP-heptose synthase [Acidobacteriota bacterium]